MTGDKRQQALVKATFELIAERGLEGLRTREIAARAGMNVAMVHYYFAGKDSLIGSVVGYLAYQFNKLHGPAQSGGAPPALARLRQEFADTRYYRAEHPELGTVYQELLQRSRRDPAIQPMIEYLEDAWFDSFASILSDGVREGTFRPDLDLKMAAGMIVAMLRGAFLSTLRPFDFDGALAETEGWLAAKQV
jgi:AcrR family transcriptional regulator